MSFYGHVIYVVLVLQQYLYCISIIIFDIMSNLELYSRISAI